MREESVRSKRLRRWAAGALLLSTLSPSLRAQTPDAAQVLTSARDALGGEKKLAAVRTFTVTGRTRQVRGTNLVPIEFQIDCELPGKFVRKDEFPAQDADPTTLGFSGEELILFPPPPAGRGGGPPPPARSGGAPPTGRADAPAADAGRRGGAIPPSPAQQRLVGVKQDFARLLLGAFATSFDSYPLTFKYAAQGEAPEGKADILDVAGPANFSARFVVQRETHLPVMLIWQLPATNVVFNIPGQAAPGTPPPGSVVVDAPAPPPAGAPQAQREEYVASIAALRRQVLAQAKPVEYRLYYADYRDVDGMKWPFRIRRAIAGETVEETTLDRVRINPKIDPKKFESPK